MGAAEQGGARIFLDGGEGGEVFFIEGLYALTMDKSLLARVDNAPTKAQTISAFKKALNQASETAKMSGKLALLAVSLNACSTYGEALPEKLRFFDRERG